MWRPSLRLLLLVFIFNAAANLSGKTNANSLEKVSNTDLYLSYFNLSYIFSAHNDSIKQGLTVCQNPPKVFDLKKDKSSEHKISHFFFDIIKPRRKENLLGQ